MENVGFFQPALLTAYPVCQLSIKPAGSEVRRRLINLLQHQKKRSKSGQITW